MAAQQQYFVNFGHRLSLEAAEQHLLLPTWLRYTASCKSFLSMQRIWLHCRLDPVALKNCVELCGYVLVKMRAA
eukprot:1161497-Pelagomonas_calceolata.AAC.2